MVLKLRDSEGDLVEEGLSVFLMSKSKETWVRRGSPSLWPRDVVEEGLFLLLVSKLREMRWRWAPHIEIRGNGGGGGTDPPPHSEIEGEVGGGGFVSPPHVEIGRTEVVPPPHVEIDRHVCGGGFMGPHVEIGGNGGGGGFVPCPHVEIGGTEVEEGSSLLHVSKSRGCGWRRDPEALLQVLHMQW